MTPFLMVRGLGSTSSPATAITSRIPWLIACDAAPCVLGSQCRVFTRSRSGWLAVMAARARTLFHVNPRGSTTPEEEAVTHEHAIGGSGARP